MNMVEEESDQESGAAIVSSSLSRPAKFKLENRSASIDVLPSGDP